MAVLGTVADLTSFLSFGYLAAFIINIPLVPKTVDSGVSWFPLFPNPYYNNVFYFSVFAVHHSGMLHPKVRSLLKSVLPKGSFSALYSITASLVVVLLCLGWSPITNTVWSLSDYPILYLFVSGLNALCWLFLTYCVLASNPIDNAFSRAINSFVTGREFKPVPKGVLLTDGIYSVIRHPTMTGLMLSMWVLPMMSLGHLLFCCFSTLYIIPAVVFLEEPKLIEEFGNGQYVKYMKKVPRFIPGVI